MLPMLPPFHPANFLSRRTDTAAVLGLALDLSQPLCSPITYKKQYLEAQKQTLFYQHEIMGSATCQSQERATKLISPYLVPSTHSGTITPLELKSANNHVAAR
jgi:hypothetical protein